MTRLSPGSLDDGFWLLRRIDSENPFHLREQLFCRRGSTPKKQAYEKIGSFCTGPTPLVSSYFSHEFNSLAEGFSVHPLKRCSPPDGYENASKTGKNL
jgi:hypothetical protein